MNKKVFFIIFLISICFQEVSAQANKSKLFLFEFGQLISISSNSKFNQEFNSFRVKFSVYKNLNDKLGLGISLGTDAYREKGNMNFKTFYNTLPFNLNSIYFLNQKERKLFADANFGYALPIFKNFEQGFNIGVGGGYLFNVGEKTKFSLKTGYNYQNIKNAEFINNNFESLNIGSIKVTIGFVF